jgi:hypothetical protein
MGERRRRHGAERRGPRRRARTATSSRGARGANPSLALSSWAHSTPPSGSEAAEGRAQDAREGVRESPGFLAVLHDHLEPVARARHRDVEQAERLAHLAALALAPQLLERPFHAADLLERRARHGGDQAGGIGALGQELRALRQERAVELRQDHGVELEPLRRVHGHHLHLRRGRVLHSCQAHVSTKRPARRSERSSCACARSTSWRKRRRSHRAVACVDGARNDATNAP